MAASIRNVHSIYKKIARYREVYKQIGVRLGTCHDSNRYFHATTFLFTDEPLKHDFEDHDLDFYGIDNLKQESYQTEFLDDMRCQRLQGINVSVYTRRAHNKMRHIHAENEMPYGTIRYDKGSKISISRLKEREEIETKQRIKRREEKARKKEEKKVRKLELRTKNETIQNCVSAYSFEDNIHESYTTNDQLQHVEHTSDKVQGVFDKEPSSGDHTSYCDQMYFGNVEEKYDKTKGVGNQRPDNETVDVKENKSAEQNIQNYTPLNLQRSEKSNFISVMQMKQKPGVIFSRPNQMDCAEHSENSPNELQSMGFIDKQFFDPQSMNTESSSTSVQSKYGGNEHVPVKEYNECHLTDEDLLVRENRRPDEGSIHFKGNGAVKEPIMKVKSKHGIQNANHDRLLAKTEQSVLNKTKPKADAVLRLKDVEKECDKTDNPGLSDQEAETAASTQKQKRRERIRVTGKAAIGDVDNADKPTSRSKSTDKKLNLSERSKDIDRLQSFQNVRSKAEIGNRRVTLSKRKTLDQNESNSSVYMEARKLREESERKNKLDVYGRANPKIFDSAGFRILSGQTPDFQHVPSMDIIKVLRQNILFDGHDVVAISKPYGIPLDGGKGSSLCIDQFLNDIIPSTTLHSVETVETGVTGVMLFGKTEDMKNNLAEKLKEGEVCRKLLTITKNVPKLSQGEIDIPIVEGTVNGRHRMALRPHRTPDLAPFMRRQQKGRDAVTRYRVLDAKDNKYALLECIPLTRVKHQLRVHLSFGLNCPILGDHKYAHLDKMAPMNLHPIMLEKLKIQQSKVRHLAIHLHCRSVSIPNFLNGRNLFVSAPFPVHFLANMRDLKLKLPSHS